jgi:enediyne biosynthesis protein E3
MAERPHREGLVVVSQVGERNLERGALSNRGPVRALAARLLAIDPAETSFARRGFAECPDATRARLEEHGAAFVRGFNLGLATDPARGFDAAAQSVPPAERGFAYEGAGMAYALLDLLAPRRLRRLAEVLAASGADHVYMVHLGAGCALARLRMRPFGRLRLDPLLRWLAVDGFGFHEGFFRHERFVRERARHPRLTGYAVRVFDQGLGRSLWFVDGADPERIEATIATLPANRHGDLWSGVGLEAAYAGAIDASGLERLRRAAGKHASHAAQGAAVAAAARVRAGNLVPETELAAAILCGRDADAAAQLVARARASVAIDEDGRGYEQWRARIRDWLPRTAA